MFVCNQYAQEPQTPCNGFQMLLPVMMRSRSSVKSMKYFGEGEEVVLVSLIMEVGKPKGERRWQ